MVQDLSQQLDVPSGANNSVGGAAPRQAVTGVMPPQLGEAQVREAWPTVLEAQSGLARLAHTLIKTIVLAPLGWLLLLPLFGKRLLPFLSKRYTLTNRRLMVQRGLKPSPAQEVALSDIDEVRLVEDSFDRFYLSGTLEIISKGQVVMTLTGVPEPEGFRHAVVNAVKAWVPGKATGPFQPASAVK
ncbi:MAG TPA: PH domain-containing protein [Gemmataceae bacterium]|jgi:hypothetical protein|nr:PH domain-containing protein [Gemmataceae bacterium]